MFNSERKIIMDEETLNRAAQMNDTLHSLSDKELDSVVTLMNKVLMDSMYEAYNTNEELKKVSPHILKSVITAALLNGFITGSSLTVLTIALEKPLLDYFVKNYPEAVLDAVKNATELTFEDCLDAVVNGETLD